MRDTLGNSATLTTNTAEEMDGESEDESTADSLQSRAEATISNYSPANDVNWVYSACSSGSDLRYFDKSWTQQMIADGQRQTIANFPSRSFRVMPGTLRANCNSASGTCAVTGRVSFNWVNSSTGETRSGARPFQFVTKVQGDGMVISSERWGSGG